MQYTVGDIVWYRGQFANVEYAGLVRGPADNQPDTDEPTYVLTLLSGPFAGDTSTVYECELRPRAHPATPHHGDSIEPGEAPARSSKK
jgi:hypothetical protein